MKYRHMSSSTLCKISISKGNSITPLEGKPQEEWWEVILDLSSSDIPPTEPSCEISVTGVFLLH